jgi:hypothetical protein
MLAAGPRTMVGATKGDSDLHIFGLLAVVSAKAAFVTSNPATDNTEGTTIRMILMLRTHSFQRRTSS